MRRWPFTGVTAQGGNWTSYLLALLGTSVQIPDALCGGKGVSISHQLTVPRAVQPREENTPGSPLVQCRCPLEDPGPRFPPSAPRGCSCGVQGASAMPLGPRSPGVFTALVTLSSLSGPRGPEDLACAAIALPGQVGMAAQRQDSERPPGKVLALPWPTDVEGHRLDSSPVQVKTIREALFL